MVVGGLAWVVMDGDGGSTGRHTKYEPPSISLISQGQKYEEEHSFKPIYFWYKKCKEFSAGNIHES